MPPEKTNAVISGTTLDPAHIRSMYPSINNHSLRQKDLGLNNAYLGPLAKMSAVDRGAPAPPDDWGGGSGACGAAALATGCAIRARRREKTCY